MSASISPSFGVRGMRMISRSMVVLARLPGGCTTVEMTTPVPKKRLAPTPYTTEQIREAIPRETRLVFRLERNGESTVLHVMEFVDADADAVVTESVISQAGDPIGDVGRSEATWVEL